MSDHFLKLLIIGDSGVGKSCILTRYCQNKFVNAFYNTIGVDFKTKHVTVDGTKCKLQIWDTAGQQRFRTITANYYKGAHGILIVFDITSRESFENASFWLQEIQKHGNSNLIRILIGNKCDLEDKRQVSQDEGLQFSKSNNLEYIEVSALKDANVDLVFQTIARKLLNQRKAQKSQIVTDQDTSNKLEQKLYEKKQKIKQKCC